MLEVGSSSQLELAREQRSIVRIVKRYMSNSNDVSSFCLSGSQDAVAAGTVGAWTSLSATNTAGSSSPFPPVIPEDSFASLDEFVEIILNHCSENTFGLSRVQVQAMAAFAFGLACGSASCLLEENSILDTMDVKRLFKVMVNSPPELIHKTTIRRPEVF